MKILLICGDHPRHRFMLEPVKKKFNQITCIMMKRESFKKGFPTIINNQREKKLISKHFNLRYLKEKKAFGTSTVENIFLSKNFIKINKNQLNKEMRAEIENGMASEFIEFEGEWGIVSIQGVMFPNADPIPPSTIIRNKLGVNFGGSGAEINKDEYEDSVRFWEANALIK